MLKNMIVVLILLMSGSVFAEAPDLLYQQCVDPLDRQDIRAMRNLCDDEATRQGYNVGIFRPYSASQDLSPIFCPVPLEKPHLQANYVCLGAPHKEPTGCLPPCGPP